MLGRPGAGILQMNGQQLHRTTGVGQAAKGARDQELISAVAQCEEETASQRRWLYDTVEGGRSAGASGR
jgi:hypothetical protein